MCTITYFFNAIGQSGTPSQGDTRLGLRSVVNVPNGDFIIEFISDGGGFSACPGVIQNIVKVWNPKTGQIVSASRTGGCHLLQLVSYVNSCQSSGYDCVNGVCVSSETYSTPGIYQSMSECEQNCSNPVVCPEGYECVSIESTQQLKDCICS